MGAHGLTFQGLGFEPVGDGGRYVAETQSPCGLARHMVDASTGELMGNGREPLRALTFFLTPIDPVRLVFPFAAAIRTAEVRSGGKVLKGHATTAQDRILYRIGVSARMAWQRPSMSMHPKSYRPLIA